MPEKYFTDKSSKICTLDKSQMIYQWGVLQTLNISKMVYVDNL